MTAVAQQVVDAARDLLRRRTGLVFPDNRRDALERGLDRSMAGAFSDPERYLAQLETDAALLDELVADVTVGESYFFREPEQVQVIRQQVIPDLLAAPGHDHALRVWSAGCASGEEPYTLAILLYEAGLLRAAHLVGTDISRRALGKARRAVYGRWSLRGVPEATVDAYFERTGDRFRLRAELGRAVEYRYLNLAADSYPSLAAGVWGMDLILCRNVLIYLDPETVARVARRLLDSLSHRGWLLLGASDPMLSGLVLCDVVTTEAGLAYRRRGARRAPARVEPPAPPAPPEPNAQPATEEVAEPDMATSEGDVGSWIQLIRAHANRGDLAAAGRACAGALERHRDSAEVAYLHAVLLAEAGRHADAAAAARRALYLDRGLVVAHLALGAALARTGDAAGARRAFRNAERLLGEMPADAPMPAADGESAGRLAMMARLQADLLRKAPA